jgi:hypothetical protein
MVKPRDTITQKIKKDTINQALSVFSRAEENIRKIIEYKIMKLFNKTKEIK